MKLVFKNEQVKYKFGADENILKFTVAIVAKFCEYTKNDWIIHFRWVNYMVCELSQ